MSEYLQQLKKTNYKDWCVEYLRQFKITQNDWYVNRTKCSDFPKKEVMLADYIELLQLILKAEGNLPVTVGDEDCPKVPWKITSEYVKDREFHYLYVFDLKDKKKTVHLM